MTQKQKHKNRKDVTGRDVIDFACHVWRKRKLHFAAMLLFITATVVVDVLVPYYGGRIIDAVASDPAYAGDNGFAVAMTMLGVFIGLFFLFNINKTLCSMLWVDYTVRVLRDVLNDSFFKVQRFSSNWHANEFAGATVRKITRGMWGVDLFGDTIWHGIYPAVLLLFGVTIMVGSHWISMGVLLFCLSIVLIVVSIIGNVVFVAPANRAANEQDSKVSATLADAVTCNAVVKSFGSEEREDETFRQTAHEWARRSRRSWLTSDVNYFVQRLIVMVMMGSLLGYAIYLWREGLATPGQVTFIMSSCFMVAGYLRDMGNNLRNLQKSINDMEDVILFRKMNFDIDDAGGASDLNAQKGEIIYDQVEFAYQQNGRKIYDDFSLHIKGGERVGLVGHSGSGKSTCIKLLQRLYDIQDGAITIDGQNIADVTQQSLHRAVALVPQEPILFHRSLADNISYARPGASRDEIMTAAKRAYAHDFIEHLDDGYDTLVGERGVKLSGGERQRVAIARAFLADAPILVLDEATSSLDSVSEALIQDALDQLMKGRTTLIIAHRLSTIQDVDRILVFSQGKIVEQGHHNDLVLKADGYYAHLYKMQVEGFGDDQKPTLKKQTIIM